MRFALLALVLASSMPAMARWKPEYAKVPANILDWYKSQHNALGTWCCSKADGHAYYGTYKINKDGSVTLANGHKIPSFKVLKGPNPTGHAVWWRLEGHDYCFALGPLM